MSEPRPHWTWGPVTPSRILACLSMICFVVLACGGSVGSLPLLAVGLALLAAALVF